MEVDFWTTGCPKCSVLKMKLDAAKIDYVVKDDVDEMISLGMRSAPSLSVDGKIMGFKEAIEWVRGQKVV